MNREFAKVIIETAFELTNAVYELDNEFEYVDEYGSFDVEKFRENEEVGSDLEVICYLDCSEGEQQDDRDIATEIIDNVEDDDELIKVIVKFEDSICGNPQKYIYLLKKI